jgi:hypothetical protein
MVEHFYLGLMTGEFYFKNQENHQSIREIWSRKLNYRCKVTDFLNRPATIFLFGIPSFQDGQLLQKLRQLLQSSLANLAQQFGREPALPTCL